MRFVNQLLLLVLSMPVLGLQAGDACDCPIDPCETTEVLGNLGLNPCRTLLTNFINPVAKINGVLQADDSTDATTCFSGNAAVHPNRILMTNFICPVLEGPACHDACAEHLPCDGTTCVEDKLGKITLSGCEVEVLGRLIARNIKIVLPKQDDCNECGLVVGHCDCKPCGTRGYSRLRSLKPADEINDLAQLVVDLLQAYQVLQQKVETLEAQLDDR